MEFTEHDWSSWQPLNSIAEVLDPHLDGPGVFEVRLAIDAEPLPFPSSKLNDQRGVVFIGYATESLRSQLTEFRGRIEKDRLSSVLADRRFTADSINDSESAHPDLWPKCSVECRWADCEKDEAREVADERKFLYVWRFGDYPPLNERPVLPEDHDSADFDWSAEAERYVHGPGEKPGTSPDNPVVYCADVGLVSKGRFGWSRSPKPTTIRVPGRDTGDIESLASSIAEDLAEGLTVALGFECPLFIPVRNAPAEMRKARRGEGNRPWSAAARLGSLAVGLSQTVWLLRAVQKRLEGTGQAFLDWDGFLEAGEGLFVWEAFVSGDAKTSETDASSNVEDAAKAIWAFVDALPNPESANAIQEESVHSLIGAALLRTGWSDDRELLSTPCLALGR